MVRYKSHKWYLRTRHDVTETLSREKFMCILLHRDPCSNELYGFVYLDGDLSEAFARRYLGLPDADEDTGTSVLSPLLPGAEFRYEELRLHPPATMHMYAWDPRVWNKKRHHYWVDRSKRSLTVY